MPRLILISCLACLTGCVSHSQISQRAPAILNAPNQTRNVTKTSTPIARESARRRTMESRSIALVSHSVESSSSAAEEGEIQLYSSHEEESPYDVLAQAPTSAPKPVEDETAEIPTNENSSVVKIPASEISFAAPTQDEIDPPLLAPVNSDEISVSDLSEAVELNLPSALAMIDGQHPIVGFAQWKVQEAYAQLARAQALWLPSIQAGFSFHRHDGNYQASDGSIVDVNRNSFQYGLGTGATGAGTTPLPGLVAQFHLADAIFSPQIAEKTAWARGHAAQATVNEQLLEAATAYIALVDAHQDVRILERSRERTKVLSKLTHDFAEAGQGLQADAERLQTELELTENRLVSASEKAAMASARLAQALSLDGGVRIVPLDVTAIPVDLIAADCDKFSLVGTGLATRPELKESQALVAAACEAYRREKYAPFVPSVLLGMGTSGFGGGLGTSLNNVDGRYDFDAQMSWQIRNFGATEKAARREASSRIQQARFEKLRVMDQVAREISEAHSKVQYRRRQIEITQRAIKSAEASFNRNLERIRDGQGLPLEVLQSVQALEYASRAYLRAVITHNEAQFELQWSLGWPVDSLASSAG